MTSGAASPVGDLGLLDPDERQELLTRWNATEAPIPDAATHRRFEAIAAGSPERTAVRTSAGMLSYGELNARANRLARHLRDLGVERDRLVGIHVDRSPDMLVAMLAVHKAGGAYVPLDPLFPGERLAMIASDARLDVVVTQEALVGTMDVGEVALVVLDRDGPSIAKHDSADLGLDVDPADLAYVIYTSGSTGRPKGVEVTPPRPANFLERDAPRARRLAADDVLLAVTTMSFDIAGLELFLPLIVGATRRRCADQAQAVDALWLRERLGAGDITVMQATPATWRMLLDAGWTRHPGPQGALRRRGARRGTWRDAAGQPGRIALEHVRADRDDDLVDRGSGCDGAAGSPSIGRPIANTAVLRPRCRAGAAVADRGRRRALHRRRRGRARLP